MEAPGFEPLQRANNPRGKMPENKGADGATSGVVGLAPGISPTDASTIVPGRKEERVSEVAGRVWVRWQDVQGGSVGWLLFPPGRQGNQRPPHLIGHLGRWGWGGNDSREGTQVKRTTRNLKRSHLSSWLILLFFSSKEQAGAGLCDAGTEAQTGKLRLGVGEGRLRKGGGLWGEGSGTSRGLVGRLHQEGQGVFEVEKQV